MNCFINIYIYIYTHFFLLRYLKHQKYQVNKPETGVNDWATTKVDGEQGIAQEITKKEAAKLQDLFVLVNACWQVPSVYKALFSL